MIKTSKQLKGGMLVAAVIGMDMRATMDIVDVSRRWGQMKELESTNEKWNEFLNNGF
jgi:hypothetical protein